MNRKPRPEKRRQFMQKGNLFLRADTAARTQYGRQTNIVPLADGECNLPLCRKRAGSSRRGGGGDLTAQHTAINRTRTIGERPHAISPLERSTASPISAVCIPCAAPLIITEAS